MSSILNENQAYTFSNFFELRLDAIDLANYFGYRFRRTRLDLPQYLGALDRLAQLEEDLFDIIPRLVRMNEQSKREALIFPVIKTAARYANAFVRIEQPIKVSHQLQGSLDYLLSTDNLHQLVVIEAKQGDIDYGFTQLLSELIALDQWERSPTREEQPKLIGAVTIGELWRFGVLDRVEKQISEDIIGYRVPSDLETVLRLLIQALR